MLVLSSFVISITVILVMVIIYLFASEAFPYAASGKGDVHSTADTGWLRSQRHVGCVRKRESGRKAVNQAGGEQWRPVPTRSRTLQSVFFHEFLLVLDSAPPAHLLEGDPN